MRAQLTRIWLLLTLALAGLSSPGRAQGLSLAQALEQASRQSFPSRAAAALADVQSAQASQTLRGFLPAIRLETGYLRTTDPLGAFGAILRERAVTPAAFSPDRLNNPNAISQVASALVLEQPLFNLDAFYGRAAARYGANAGQASLRWARSGGQLDVVRAYYGAVLATEQVATLETALAAAQAHQRQAESMHRNGLVTASDELLASVRAGEVEVQVNAARGAARLARIRLAVALGSSADSAGVIPSRLPDMDRILAVANAAESPPAAPRADVEAAHLGERAAAADQHRATALLFPRINAFGRLDWVSADTPFGGRESWTAGVMLSWSLFAGGNELAERRIARARRIGAAVETAAVEARAQLELAQATIAVDVALARVAIMSRSVEQSTEAHRIITRKYEGGIATVSEVLDAAATETGARLGFSDARFAAIEALAERRRMNGVDLATLTSLDTGE